MYVTPYDREGHLLHRNDEVAVWELGAGLEPGRRQSCMDIRANHRDSVLVHAPTVGDARIRVALGGVEAHADVTIVPAAP